MTFELQAFRGSSSEVQYFGIINAAISFVCSRIIHPNTFNEISRQHAPRANVDPAMRQQDVSFAYAHEICQLLVQAATELIPRSPIAPQSAVGENVAQEHGQAQRELEYWQNVRHIRGAEDPDHRNSRGATQTRSQEESPLQSESSPAVGVSTPSKISKQLRKSNGIALHVATSQSTSQSTVAKGGHVCSKLPIADRVISKKSKRKAKCIPNNGMPARLQRDSKANISKFATKNNCALLTTVTNHPSRGSFSTKNQGMDRILESLQGSALPTEINEVSAAAAQHSDDQAKTSKAHRDACENALRLQAQTVSRGTTDLSSSPIPVANRAAKNQIENGSFARATAAAQKTYHARVQTALLRTMQSPCPSILAIARVRRSGVSTSFPSSGVSPGMHNPVPFPAQATSAGMNHSYTPASIQHRVNSAEQNPISCTAPSDFAFANSPGGIPDNLRAIFSRIDPNCIGKQPSAYAHAGNKEEGEGQVELDCGDQDPKQMKERRDESPDTPFEITAEPPQDSWNEAHTRAILDEWTYEEDKLHRDWQPPTDSDGIFEGTDEEVSQRLKEIFFLETSNK